MLPWYVILVVVAAGTLLAGTLGAAALRARSRRSRSPLHSSVLHHLVLPVRLVIALVGMEVATAAADMPPGASSDLQHLWTVGLDLAVGLTVVRGVYVLSDVVLARFPLDNPDNLRARSIATQIQVVRRVSMVLVSVVAIAVALLTFSSVRAAGAGLLASAGLVGLAAGIAARPILTNLLAGIQIALSQPIRVDDVVVVEGEWGRIEQIALTYVVVRIWDLRRLVVPISYFVESSFENWTREGSQVIGTIHLELDYSAPVEQLRAAFHDVVSASPDWDGQTAVLQVTSAGTETMQVRCIMTSADASRSWNLQCEVREKLIAHLQREHPGALPRLRVAFADPAGVPDPVGADAAV